MLVECEEIGAAAAVARRLQARERLPGFGHKIYQGEDPRLAPLLEAVALLPDPAGRRDVVDDLLVETSARGSVRRPNVDLGVGALLSYVAGLPADVPLFAVARLAGFAAHLDERLQERPLRYRGLARPRAPSGAGFSPDPTSGVNPDFPFRFLVTPMAVEEDPMAWLAYNRERVDDLWRHTHAAIDDLTTITSDDPAAAEAIRVVRLAQAHLERVDATARPHPVEHGAHRTNRARRCR